MLLKSSSLSRAIAVAIATSEPQVRFWHLAEVPKAQPHVSFLTKRTFSGTQPPTPWRKLQYPRASPIIFFSVRKSHLPGTDATGKACLW